MAFLRFSRDKRGYEYFYLLQPSTRRGSKARPRLLYCFRTPPNVKVGRSPFDPEVRRALEVSHPDVAFDWDAIVRTPIPPPETEHWRERRRASRSARQASEKEADTPEVEDQPAAEAMVSEGGPEAAGMPTGGEAEPSPAAEETGAAEPSGQLPAQPPALEFQALPAPAPQGRHRRRRRGRRRHQGGAAPIQGLGTPGPQGKIPTGEPGSGGPEGEV